MLIIGNEVLSGRTKESNLQVLAKALNEKGIRLTEVRVVRDSEGDIINGVNELRHKYDYVFTSGGIGPTHDDITTASVAKAIGVEVYRHPEAKAAMITHYKSVGSEATESRLRMADVPVTAKLINCQITPAPGFHIENVFVLAGVPSIFEAMIQVVIPTLEQGPAYSSRTIVVRVGESQVANDLEKVQNIYPELELGSYPQQDDEGYFTELVIAGNDKQSIDVAYNELSTLLNERSVPIQQ